MTEVLILPGKNKKIRIDMFPIKEDKSKYLKEPTLIY